jgi:C_GCAxxG_C_C family probable redox protein
MNRGAIAESYLKQGNMNCAQSVLLAFSEDYGLKKEDALRVAMLFGGGMGGTGRTCGAVVGAYMVMGLKLGSDFVAEKNRELTHKMVIEFNQKFTGLHGDTTCKGILGFDVGIPAEAAMAESKGLFSSVCQIAVRDAARILEQMDFRAKPK